MLCGAEHILQIKDLPVNEWIGFAIFNVVALITIFVVLPNLRLLKDFKDKALEEFFRRIRNFFFSLGGPRFISIRINVNTIIGINFYFGVMLLMIMVCPVIPSFFLTMGMVTLIIWHREFITRVTNRFMNRISINGIRTTVAGTGSKN